MKKRKKTFFTSMARMTYTQQFEPEVNGKLAGKCLSAGAARTHGGTDTSKT